VRAWRPAMTPGAGARNSSVLSLTRLDAGPAPRGSLPALADAVRATVAYADVFDFPLTDDEIHRDLIGMPAAAQETRAATAALIAEGLVGRASGFVCLPDRGDLADERCRRAEHARRLWPRAQRVGRILGTFPFVRLVAVTGSLAADNPDPRADLDYLIVAAPGRLWLARAMAVGLVRLARELEISICPN